MIDVRMDASSGDQTKQLHALASLEGRNERRILEERTVLDRSVHSHQVLEEHAAGADRQMPDLAIAHLPGWQADRRPGRIERRVRERPPQPIERRGVGEVDGVAGPGRRAAPAVENDERYERIRAPARQISVKDSRSREAPPTSAPSTSG